MHETLSEAGLIPPPSKIVLRHLETWVTKSYNKQDWTFEYPAKVVLNPKLQKKIN